MSVHYVATVKVERVEREKAATSSYSRSDPPPHPGRVVSTLASVVVKGTELNALCAQVGGHLALVQDVEGEDL